MGILKKFFTRSKKEVEVREEQSPLLRALMKGEEIDRDKAMEIPIVASCVEEICNLFAQIPFRLYKKEFIDGKQRTKEVQDPRVKLINSDTNDTLDSYQFKKAMCEDYLLGKGGYAYIKKLGNKVVGLFFVKESDITINKNFDPIYKKFIFLVNSQQYHSFEFLKLLRNTKDGASGVGVTKQIAKALETAYKRLEYDFSLAATGGSRKGFLKSNKHIGAKELEALKEAWEKYYSGNANTVVLNDGIEFQEASNTSKENEIDAKNITFIKEIQSIFHIKEDYDEFIKFAIMPIAEAFATALNRDLLLEKEKDDYYFAPDFKALIKGNIKERYDAYKIAIEKGFKTRNEIRFLEDDDAIPGLDVISLGLGDVLLNPNTQEVYTPNTNKLYKIGEEIPSEEDNTVKGGEEIDES